METLYFDGKPVSITLTGLEKKLARTILDLSAGEDGFELYNNDVALFEQDPGEPVFGCNFERVEHIEWKDRRQLGALLTSLEKKHVLYVEEDPHDGNGIWYSHKVLKALAV